MEIKGSFNSNDPSKTELETTLGDMVHLLFKGPLEAYRIDDGIYKFGENRAVEFTGIVFVDSNGLLVGGTYEPKSMRKRYPIFGRTALDGDTRNITFFKLLAKATHCLNKSGTDIEGHYKGVWESNYYKNYPLVARFTLFTLKKTNTYEAMSDELLNSSPNVRNVKMPNF